MKKILLCVVGGLMILGGCGYSTRTVAPTMVDIKTIYVEPFQNKVDYGTEKGDKNLYIPMMEVKVTNGVVNRFITDGFLKVAKREDADIILKGELINYRRDVLRYDDNDNNAAKEYRITIIVALTLSNVRSSEILWTEPNFGGEATYLVAGPGAKSESTAIDEAVKDLAQRIIERTVEDW